MKDQEFEDILRQALCPEVAQEDTAVDFTRAPRKGGSTRRVLKRAGVIAAVLVLLAGTVYAARNTAEIAHLITTGDMESCRSYRRLDRLMTKADFRMDAPEEFSNGYGFRSAQVQDVHALDADRNLRFTFYEISVEYEDPAGNVLQLVAHERINGLPDQGGEVVEARQIGTTAVSCYGMHYKYVPDDYELTPEDEKLLERADYQISYGANQALEVDFRSLRWEREGICYSLVDMGRTVETETLFSMAEEMLLG